MGAVDAGERRRQGAGLRSVLKKAGLRSRRAAKEGKLQLSQRRSPAGLAQGWGRKGGDSGARRVSEKGANHCGSVGCERAKDA